MLQHLLTHSPRPPRRRPYHSAARACIAFTVRARMRVASELEADAEVQLPPTRLVLTYATEWKTDFLGERVPVNQQDWVGEGAVPPLALRALPPSPRAARDTRLPATSAAMPSEREREAGLELDIAAWGGSGFGSPLPIAAGASERWLPSGSGARLASGSGPHPSHTRTELDAWRRKGPGGVGAGPVGVGLGASALSPRTPRRA